MKKFTFEYVQKRWSDITVLANTKEEAETKVKNMEENKEIDMDHPEHLANHFCFIREADVDPDEDILADCVEKRFDGDILITDPCYIHHQLPDPEREKGFWDYFCRHSFDKFEVDNAVLFSYGLYNTLVGQTIYGDWSCTTYMKHEGRDIDIGRFCADAGLVGVFLLEEVEKFNPNFIRWLIRHQHCGTVISGLNGIVKAITTRKPVDKPENDISLLTHTVHLEGVGGKCKGADFFEFYTKQTGY